MVARERKDRRIVTLPPETLKEFDAMAERFGMNWSSLANQCIVIGMRQLCPLAFPEELVTPALKEQMVAEIIRQSAEQANELDKALPVSSEVIRDGD